MKAPVKKKTYKRIVSPGVTVIILNGKKVLLLKRLNIPFIPNPEIWGFLSGATRKNEPHVRAAIREIYEETRISEPDLTLLKRIGDVDLVDQKKMKIWKNELLIFRSNTAKVRINYENTAYRWAPYNDIVNELSYTNIFKNPALIKRALRTLL